MQLFSCLSDASLKHPNRSNGGNTKGCWGSEAAGACSVIISSVQEEDIRGAPALPGYMISCLRMCILKVLCAPGKQQV